jgi:hypothetical protein
MTPQDSQLASNAAGKRKVALITGITGQVIIIKRIFSFILFELNYLGWKLSCRISS